MKSHLIFSIIFVAAISPTAAKARVLTLKDVLTAWRCLDSGDGDSNGDFAAIISANRRSFIACSPARNPCVYSSWLRCFIGVSTSSLDIRTELGSTVALAVLLKAACEGDPSTSPNLKVLLRLPVVLSFAGLVELV